MKKTVRKCIKFFANRILGRKNSKKIAHLLLKCSTASPFEYFTFLQKRDDLSALDMIRIGYRAANIDDYGSEAHTGELYLVKEVLPKLLDMKQATIFDVGANVGNYTLSVSAEWPESEIYAFEPNPRIFNLLNNVNNKKVKKYNIGFGSVQQMSKIYVYADERGGSEHGSLLKDIFTSLHQEENIKTLNIQIERLDDFCLKNNITGVDFLKIDTEGYEYEVLKGAAIMLDKNKIKIIQLEFNEMNVVSKVFLLDFYNLLQEKFNFYRLKKNGLEYLGVYSTYNEIFRYQNLVLINKNISQEHLR